MKRLLGILLATVLSVQCAFPVQAESEGMEIRIAGSDSDGSVYRNRTLRKKCG